MILLVMILLTCGCRSAIDGMAAQHEADIREVGAVTVMP